MSRTTSIVLGIVLVAFCVYLWSGMIGLYGPLSSFIFEVIKNRENTASIPLFYSIYTVIALIVTAFSVAVATGQLDKK